MANQNQLGGVAVVGGDLARYASGVNDIPAGLAVVYDPAHPETLDAPPGVLVPNGGLQPLRPAGITIDTLVASTGFPGRVRTLGIAVCTAAGTIATGTPVTPSITGGKQGWVTAAQAGDPLVGIAQNDAFDGDPIAVQLTLGANQT